MAITDDPLVDEDYASEEDSDFAPEAAPVDDASEASESEDGEATKRKRVPENAEDDGYDNSGDEAIITKGKKRQKKSKKKDGAAEEEEEGGEGGLIKTRSMRAVEKAERKTQASRGPVTIDVDDIWAKMMAGPAVPSNTAETEGQESKDAEQESGKATEQAGGDTTAVQPGDQDDTDPSAMIKIKRTYNFAGKVHTEEKMVPRDSAEAKVYLESLDPEAQEAALNDDEEPKRQPRKAFRSMYEPIVELIPQRADLNLGMSVRLQLREQAKGANAKKLNTVEKSRMDWAGFVDKEGIKDELELAGKSKESYANREDFLARVDAKRDDEARRARIASKV